MARPYKLREKIVADCCTPECLRTATKRLRTTEPRCETCYRRIMKTGSPGDPNFVFRTRTVPVIVGPPVYKQREGRNRIRAFSDSQVAVETACRVTREGEPPVLQWNGWSSESLESVAQEVGIEPCLIRAGKRSQGPEDDRVAALWRIEIPVSEVLVCMLPDKMKHLAGANSSF